MRSMQRFFLSAATAALAVLATGASHAQGTFDYATVANPSVINGNVLVTGTTGYHFTAPTTGLTLATFNVQGNATGLNTPFTIDLTVNAPYNVPNAQTKSLSADLLGSFSSNGFLGLHTTSNSTSVTSLPTGVVFNFGNVGTYTFSNFKYVPAVGNPTIVNADGTLTADVSYAVSTPEPSSVAAFGFVGLGAAALVLRARKRTSTTA